MVEERARYPSLSEEDPQLLVGWRPSRRRLTAQRVPLQQSTFAELRGIGTEALERLASTEGRPYEPEAELDEGEHFVLPVGDLPGPEHAQRAEDAVSRRESADDVEDVADLLQLIDDTQELDALDATTLARGQFLFYAIVIAAEDGRNVGFVRQMDPVHSLRKGRMFGRYGDALDRVERPDFILYGETDLVVTDEKIYAFRTSALTRLLSDVDVALQQAPSFVERAGQALQGRVELADSALVILKEACSRRPSYAVRVRRLTIRLESLGDLTADRIRKALTDSEIDASLLLDEQGNFEFEEKHVRTFFDFMEGRWFQDPLGAEWRRADRFARRRL